MYVYKSVICHNIYVQRMVRVILKTKQWFNKMSTIFTTQSQASRQLILHAYSTDTVHVSKGLNVSFGCWFGSLWSSKDIPKSKGLIPCCRGHSTPNWTLRHLHHREVFPKSELVLGETMRAK